MKKKFFKVIIMILLVFLGICGSVVSVFANPGYVIITTNEIYNVSHSKTSIDAFKAQKDSHGYTTYIVTQGEWGGGTGDTAAENIRSWLQDNTSDKNIEYVLLIGNPDPGSGDVPMKSLWLSQDATTDIPTDYYYNCLTGNWDLDNDGRYGESPDDFGTGGINIDVYQVIVGRIPHYPVDTPSDLNNILTKIISYNNDTYNGNCAWRKSVLIPIKTVMNPNDYIIGENIKDNILIPNNWSYHRIYEDDFGLIPPPETYPCNYDNVTNAWNSQPFGTVFWATHGSAYHAVDIIDQSHDVLLIDTYPSFILQGSCDNAWPEASNNLAYRMLKYQGVAAVASTRHFSLGLLNILLHKYAYLLIESGLSGGKALNDLKIGESNWGIKLYFNLYGDPSTSLYPFRISPRERIHGCNVETGNINVEAPGGWSWNATSSDPWITITSGNSGVGNGLVEYSLQANYSGIDRSGTIIIGDKVFKVKQELFTHEGSILPSTRFGSVSWGDYDNDGDLDLLVTGSKRSEFGYITKVYKNNGDGTFTDINAVLTDVWMSSAEWGDYNNDDYLDILLTGSAGGIEKITKVYRNNGDDTFTDINAGLPGICKSSIDWGDYDNDGDLDILLTGETLSDLITKVYRNNGDDTFTDINAGLTGLQLGSAAWGDYNNDGDLDILVTGDSGFGNKKSIIYKNDGNGTFTDIIAGLPGAAEGSSIWIDFDNDGDLDILLSSINTDIYINNGSSFTPMNAGLTQFIKSSADCGDYNNDGYIDIIITGETSSGKKSIIYKNNSGTSFTGFGEELPEFDNSSVALGDYDNDGDLDILATGIDENRIYRNSIQTSNTIPSAPVFMDADIVGNTVIMRWGAGYDPETNDPGLSYNLYLGTTSAGPEMASPHSNTTTGYRRIVHMGNANKNLSRAITNLPAGTYYWSVQTVDTAFAGSPFTAENQFVIEIFNKFMNKYSNKLLTVTNNSDYAKVVCQGENPSWTSQDWSMEYVSSDEVRLKNKWTGKYLTAASLGDYTDIVCQTLNTGWSSQIWKLELSEDSISWRLKNKWTGKYLTVTSNNEYASIKCQNLNAGWTSQQWYIQ